MPVSGPGSRAAHKHAPPTPLRCLKVSLDGAHLAIGEWLLDMTEWSGGPS